MKLWVDGQALQSASVHRGIGRNITELLKAIVTGYPEITLHISFNAALPTELIAARELVKGWVDDDNIHVWHGAVVAGEAVGGFTPERHFSEIMLAHHVASIDPDIAFSVSPFEGSGDLCVPLVNSYGHGFLMASIFYDAIPLRFKDHYLADTASLTYYNRRLQSYLNFDITLTISEFADKELRELTDVESSFIIHQGLSETFHDLIKVQKKDESIRSVIDGPYVFYVGGFDWRKNVKLVIEAFSLLDAPNKDELSFVVAGKIHVLEEASLRKQWSAAGLTQDKLKILGQVTDAELINLYIHALCTILPSYMEGFGLPVLESLACGTPVLVSNRGSLPEVLGGDTGLFDPTNASQLAQLIQRLGVPQFRDEFIKAAAQNMKPYSWASSADLAVQAFRQILKQRQKSSVTAQARNEITARAAKGLNLKRDFVAQGFSLADLPAKRPGRILIDTTSTNKHNPGTGIQRVVISIARCLLQKEHGGRKAQLMFGDNELPFSPIVMSPQGQLCLAEKAKQSPINFRSNDIILMLDSSWQFHSFHKQFLMSPKLRGTPIYSVLYDMVPLLTPGFCDQGMSIIFSNWIKDALEYSDGFICISKAVADQLYSFLKAIKFPRPVKIGYWHLGANFSKVIKPAKIALSNQDSASFQKKAKHYLMVGTVEPRKGHRLAIKAFSYLWAQGHDSTLTIVGKKGWAVDDLAQLVKKHPEYDKKLFWHDAVDDKELTDIYETSDVLIAASFAEGFGLPIIEAAHLKLPVIASDIPVFVEVSAGHDVCFFERGDWRSLARIVETYDTSSQKVINPSIAQAPKVLTWQESTSELLKVMQGENWYKYYEPIASLQFNEGGIGDIGISDFIPPDDRKYELTLTEGPYPSDQSDKMTCIFKLMNFSKKCWAPIGPEGLPDKGVVLAARLKTDDGLIDQGIRSSIPLTVMPDTPYYFAVDLPKDGLLNKNQYKVELLQEGVGWWGQGVDVQLSDK